jgi:hypothetical protein
MRRREVQAWACAGIDQKLEKKVDRPAAACRDSTVNLAASGRGSAHLVPRRMDAPAPLVSARGHIYLRQQRNRSHRFFFGFLDHRAWSMHWSRPTDGSPLTAMAAETGDRSVAACGAQATTCTGIAKMMLTAERRSWMEERRAQRGKRGCTGA